MTTVVVMTVVVGAVTRLPYGAGRRRDIRVREADDRDQGQAP
jgi:hypothetical protein